MVRWRQVELSAEHEAAVRKTYRPDLYRAALTHLDADIPATDFKSGRFFDGRDFHVEDMSTWLERG
jgi:hypothetical protein